MKLPRRIIVATGNTHKTGEIASAVQRVGLPVEIASAKAVGGMPEVDETGNTFPANARLKAEALQCKVNASDWVIADDSGLAVDALDGAPGVYSARYAGPCATDAENNAKLLRALAPFPTHQRTARFVCALVLLGPGVDESFHGECPGAIQAEATGEAGFGYDPLFVPQGHSQSFGELGAAAKDAISHRARACQALVAWLRSR